MILTVSVSFFFILINSQLLLTQATSVIFEISNCIFGQIALKLFSQKYILMSKAHVVQLKGDEISFFFETHNPLIKAMYVYFFFVMGEVQNKG